MVLDVDKLEKDLNTGNSTLIEGYTVTKNKKGLIIVKKNNYTREFFDVDSALDFIYG